MRSGLRVLTQSQTPLACKVAQRVQIRPASQRVVKAVNSKTKLTEFPTARGMLEAGAVGGIAYGAAQLGSFWTGLGITFAATFGTLLVHGLTGFSSRDEFKELGGRVAAYIKTDGGDSETLKQYIQNRPQLLNKYINSDDVYISEIHTGLTFNKNKVNELPKSSSLDGPKDGLRVHSIFRVGAKEGGNIKTYILQTWTPLQNKSQVDSAVNLPIEYAVLTPEFGQGDQVTDVTAAYKDAPLTIDEELLLGYRSKAYDSMVNQTGTASNNPAKWDFSA